MSLGRRKGKPRRKALADDPDNPTTYAEACAEVDRRSGGWCEGNEPGICRPGRHRAHEHHHIILRTRGGPDEAWNLLHVCDPLHDEIHAEVAWSTAKGYMRSAHEGRP